MNQILMFAFCNVFSGFSTLLYIATLNFIKKRVLGFKIMNWIKF